MTSTALAIRPSESGAARAMTYTERVTQAIDLYRAGDLDAAELDSMLTLIAGWLRWDSAIVGPNASRQRVETMCALMKIGTRLDSLQRNHSIDTREIPPAPRVPFAVTQAEISARGEWITQENCPRDSFPLSFYSARLTRCPVCRHIYSATRHATHITEV